MVRNYNSLFNVFAWRAKDFLDSKKDSENEYIRHLERYVQENHIDILATENEHLRNLIEDHDLFDDDENSDEYLVESLINDFLEKEYKHDKYFAYLLVLSDLEGITEEDILFLNLVADESFIDINDFKTMIDQNNLKEEVINFDFQFCIKHMFMIDSLNRHETKDHLLGLMATYYIRSLEYIYDSYLEHKKLKRIVKAAVLLELLWDEYDEVSELY